MKCYAPELCSCCYCGQSAESDSSFSQINEIIRENSFDSIKLLDKIYSMELKMKTLALRVEALESIISTKESPDIQKKALSVIDLAMDNIGKMFKNL